MIKIAADILTRRLLHMRILAVIFLRMPIEKIRLIFAHHNNIIRYYSLNITPFGVKVNSIV